MTIEQPESEPDLIRGRRESRKLVIAAGLTDDDIDQLIRRAQHEVEPIINARFGLNQSKE